MKETPEWKHLADACKKLGYTDPAHVLRTLFMGAYKLTSKDIDVARCVRAGMSDKEICEALELASPKRANEAVERIRQHLGTKEHPAPRLQVAVAATLYRLPAWDKERDKKTEREEQPPATRYAELFSTGLPTLLSMLRAITPAQDTNDDEENHAKVITAWEELCALRQEQDRQIEELRSEYDRRLKAGQKVAIIDGDPTQLWLQKGLFRSNLELITEVHQTLYTDNPILLLLADQILDTFELSVAKPKDGNHTKS